VVVCRDKLSRVVGMRIYGKLMSSAVVKLERLDSSVYKGWLPLRAFLRSLDFSGSILKRLNLGIVSCELLAATDSVEGRVTSLYKKGQQRSRGKFN